MDSLELYRTVIAPTPSRAVTDALMLALLNWTRDSVPPDRVYTSAQLGAWALANGYARNTDAERIVALLRSVKVDDTNAGEVNDLIVAMTRYVNPGAAG